MKTLDIELRRKLLFDMLRLRVIEEKIAELYPMQEMRCPVHLYTGQEAIAAGVSAALCVDDFVLSNHRSHGHYLTKGGDLRAMMAEIYGRESGCAGGYGGSMHLIDLSVNFLGAAPIIGSTIPIAVGAALSSSLKRDGRVSVVFFGDAAVEAGVFYESANYAALHRLPILFVCENNLYSVHTPMAERQPDGREIYRMVSALGVRSERVDGNDVEAVYREAESFVRGARAGEGPGFLECMTYRWREHAGPKLDYGVGFRTEDEFGAWRARCPIDRYLRLLINESLVSETAVVAARESFESEMDAAVAYAKASSFPDATRGDRNLFAVS